MNNIVKIIKARYVLKGNKLVETEGKGFIKFFSCYGEKEDFERGARRYINIAGDRILNNNSVKKEFLINCVKTPSSFGV